MHTHCVAWAHSITNLKQHTFTSTTGKGRSHKKLRNNEKNVWNCNR